MTLFDVGRLCVKIAGRDAGRKCVIVDTVDERFVVVDGNVRRKKVSIKHLEPLDQVLSVQEKASPDDVRKAFEELGLSVWARKRKSVPERQKKQKKKKEPLVKEKPAKKKVSKSQESEPVAPTEKAVPVA